MSLYKRGSVHLWYRLCGCLLEWGCRRYLSSQCITGGKWRFGTPPAQRSRREYYVGSWIMRRCGRGRQQKTYFSHLKKNQYRLKLWAIFGVFFTSSLCHLTAPFNGELIIYYICALFKHQSPDTKTVILPRGTWESDVYRCLSRLSCLCYCLTRIRRQLWNHMGQHNRLLLLSILDSVAISCC